MPERVADAPWLIWMLEAIHRGQSGLLQLLHGLGWTGEVDGQPAWPWAQRLAGEYLLVDQGQARQLAWSLAAVIAALALLALALLWRRRRGHGLCLLGLALAAVVLAPWPSRQVLLVRAAPSSFHRNPLPFTDAAIVRGAAQYQRLCLQCHGAAGNGQGQDAAAQAVWPPSFIGPLLWRRADGELLQAVRHGVQDSQGRTTMPGFAGQLSVDQSWELLHFLRAQAAGQLLSATGNWAQPIALPDMELRCHRSDKTRVRDWQGQRLRLVSLADAVELPPDPRMVTLWLPPAGPQLPAIPEPVDCIVASAATARQALGLVNADTAMRDVQLLADKAGWLRARNSRAAGNWSDEDLLCRSTQAPATSGAPVAEDSLTRILRLMDAEPVLYIKGGRVHGLR
ncbi:MAG: cytochrome c [Comamonas sp.]|nr:cytochrome c [Comamonas sp.]